MRFTKEQIAGIASKMRNMPKVDKKKDFNKQEAVKLLIRDIHAMQKRGYTLNQIAEILRAEGLSISTPTLKNCIQRAKSSSKILKDPAQASSTLKPSSQKKG